MTYPHAYRITTLEEHDRGQAELAHAAALFNVPPGPSDPTEITITIDATGSAFAPDPHAEKFMNIAGHSTMVHHDRRTSLVTIKVYDRGITHETIVAAVVSRWRGLLGDDPRITGVVTHLPYGERPPGEPDA